MRRLKVLLALALFVFCLPLAALEKKPLSAYSRETWTTRNGLPHNQVNAVTQTPEGYLWFATWEGLVRYNGQDFRIFSPKNEPGLQDHGIRHVSTGASGRLIVATSRGGISIMEQGVWRHIGKADGLAQNETTATVEDSQGAVWVAHESKGLSRIDKDGRISVFGLREGLPSERMYSIAMDRNKAV